MRTMTLRGATVAAALVLLAVPAHAAETDGSGEECSTMTMPGEPVATYLDEDVHSPYLDEGNVWTSLTLTTDSGETQIESPGYGSQDDAYSAEDGGVIEEIELCQAAEDAGEDTGEDDAEETEAAAPAEDESTDDAEEAAGPAVETDGPLSESGPSVGLVGGSALAIAGAGLAGYAALRRRDGQQHG